MFNKLRDKYQEVKEKVTQAVTDGVDAIYDKVAIDSNIILKSVRVQYQQDVLTWEDYQNTVPIEIMDDIAKGYILAR